MIGRLSKPIRPKHVVKLLTFYKLLNFTAMNNLHIAVVNDSNKVILPMLHKEGRLAIIDRDGEVITRTQSYLCEFLDERYEEFINELITSIWKKLTNSRWYTSNGEYTIDEDLYQRWYRWYFFIDEEDAHEFLLSCPNGNTLHSGHFQSRCGALLGWSYFKKLKAVGFKSRTAALLAYTRGYTEGMDLNSYWDKEGTEALIIMGLTRID